MPSLIPLQRPTTSLQRPPPLNIIVDNSTKILIDRLIDEAVNKFNNNEFANKYILDKGKEVVINKDITRLNQDINHRKNIKVGDNLDIKKVTDINDITDLMTEYTGQQRYEERYTLNAVLTEYVSTEFTNSKNFIYLITNFNKKLNNLIPEEYRDHIFILFKGGNVMKNLFETIKDKNVLDIKTVNYMRNYFKKSDFDFESVILNYNNMDEYKKYYDYTVNIVLFTIKSIYDILLTNSNLFFEIEKEFEANKENILELLNNKLKEIKLNNANIYKIDKFTDISINNDTSNNLYTFDETSIVDNKVNKILNITINKNNSPYHYYLNDIVEVMNDNNELSFILGRIKYTFKVRYTNLNNKTNYINLNSEILDISMARYNDYKLKYYMDNNIDKEIINYYKKDDKLDTLNYNSYTIYSLLNDLFIQFRERKYIWGTDKYDKKLNRFIFFINIYLSSELGEFNYNRLVGKFIEYINNLNQQQQYNELLNMLKNEMNINNNNVFYLFIELINKNYENTLNDTDETKELLNNIIKNIKNYLTDNKYVNYKIPKDNFELSYMEKYMKYKSKYLELKKNII